MPRTKESINIARAAQEVVSKVSKGEKVNMGEIMQGVGYAATTSRHPEKITKSPTYKRLTKPLIEGLQEEITRIKEAMAAKDLSLEEYKVLNYALDTQIKNFQLISGGATERQVFVLPSEIVEKNDIKIDKLKNGSVEPS